METLQAIFTRKSTRTFLNQPIEKEKIRILLSAAMSGPSCANRRQWSFLVVTDREQLQRMAEANGPYAHMLAKAPLGILICGDLSRASENASEYWVIDGAIAAQNMILAAHDLGLGGVWLGTWPQMARVEAQKQLFGLPEHIVPHSILAFGYPAKPNFAERDLYEADRVHFEKW